MIAILILIPFSWIVLRFGGERLSSLGFRPTYNRIVEFTTGFLLVALFAVVYYVIFIIALDAEVSFNNSYSLLEFLSSAWWTLRSVLYEELVFRGALLVLTMKYFGKLRGIFLSSIVFGIYHWFSYGVFGEIPQMINTFIITGVGGIAFAFAFAQTKSLYLPLGLHFGWNLVTISIFSQGPLGEQLLIPSTESMLGGWWRLGSILYQIIFLPLITYFCIKILHKNKFFKSTLLLNISPRGAVSKNN